MEDSRVQDSVPSVVYVTCVQCVSIRLVRDDDVAVSTLCELRDIRYSSIRKKIFCRPTNNRIFTNLNNFKLIIIKNSKISRTILKERKKKNRERWIRINRSNKCRAIT